MTTAGRAFEVAGFEDVCESFTSVADFLAKLAERDVSVFRTVNGLCGASATLDRIVVHVEILKGSLFMGIVGLLWFWPGKEMPRRREILIMMIVTVPLSLVFNRVVSMLVPFRSNCHSSRESALRQLPDLHHTWMTPVGRPQGRAAAREDFG